jgi:hypothetical protein
MSDESATAEALELFQQMIGKRYDPKQYDYEYNRVFESLKEALELDHSEIIASMLLTHYTADYVEKTSVSLADLLDGFSPTIEKLDLIRKLQGILSRPDIIEPMEAFKRAMSTGLKHYGVGERDDITSIVDDPVALAVFRRDALKSMKNLRVDQFFSGESEADDAKPVYFRDVFQWWNVNSMLAAAVNMPSGVSLNLIRDPNKFHSYFCFVIRNGGNLYVLTDAPDWAHPMQAQMSRRPDRHLDNRVARNWFPYSLLDIAYDDETGDLYFQEIDTTEVAIYQPDAIKLKEIAAVEPGETIWILMMFDLIVERFWKKKEQLAELSYTGEMIRVEDNLLEKANSANLPVRDYKPISVQSLTVNDVLSENITENDGTGKSGFGVNAWMEERYKHLVSEESLNAMSNPGRVLKLRDGEIIKAEPERFHSSWGPKNEIAIHHLDLTMFGSKERILQDRKFIARYNLAKQVDHAAKMEYEKTEKAIKHWFQVRIENRSEFLINLCGLGPLWLTQEMQEEPFNSRVSSCIIWKNADSRSRNANADKLYPELPSALRSLNSMKHKTAGDPLVGWDAFTLEPPVNRTNPKCVITGATASYAVSFDPMISRDLAFLAGVEHDQLPDVLKSWSQYRLYVGNSNLNRIDPMEWAAHNPWEKESFRIEVPLSKRGLAQLRKDAKMPDLEERFLRNVPAEIAPDSFKIG